MNLMIERAFIVALLLSISGFVFCAIFLPFEKIAYKWTSARTMVYVNTIALFSFVTPLYFVVSLRDGSERAFIQSDLLIHQDISRYDGFVYNVRDQIHMEYLGTIWLIGVIGFFIYYVWKYASLLYAVKKSMSDTEGNDIAVSKTELDVFLKIVDKLFENAGDTYHQDSYDT